MGPLRERNFRLLFIGQAASSLGNTLVPVALAFGILDLTGSPADLGYVLGAEAAALVVFILIGGVIADRIPRRGLMAFADVVRGVAQIAIGVLFIAGHVGLIPFIALSAVVGMGQALFAPASRGLTPALVKPEQLQQANALQQVASSAAGIAGPAVAGVLVVTVGPGWAMIGDAATFFVSVVLLLQLRLVAVPRPQRQHFLRDLQEGWIDFWSRRWFVVIVITGTLFNFFYAAYVVLGPVISTQHYGGAGAWAIIATSSAVGSVLAGLIAVRLKPKYPLRLANIVVAFFAIAPLALALLLPIPVVAVAGAIASGTAIVFITLWETALQQNIPEHILSRASSYDYFGQLIAYPIGLAVAGPVAASLGAPTELFWVAGLLFLIAVVTLAFPSVWKLRSGGPRSAAE